MSPAEARFRFPDECYRNPAHRGLLWLARDLALFAALMVAIARVDSPLLLLLWPLAGLAISGLFIVGHDAAHGSLFASERLNRWLGQAAMLPALHGFEAWRFGHNRVHHGHTLRRGLDYVWEPLTPAQYRALSRAQRAWHRIAWSWAGAGLYYMREIWWRRMLHFDPPARIAAAVRRERALLLGCAALASAAALGLGFARHGNVPGMLWMWFKLLAVPFLCWNQVIGTTVYVHHIAPSIPWRERRAERGSGEQLEVTTALAVPRWLNAFMHNIFVHAPHHLDVRIPFWGLPAAASALRSARPGSLQERRLRLRDYLITTRACKLFDYERGVWTDYAGRPAHLPQSL